MCLSFAATLRPVTSAVGTAAMSWLLNEEKSDAYNLTGKTFLNLYQSVNVFIPLPSLCICVFNPILHGLFWTGWSRGGGGGNPPHIYNFSSI